MLNGAASGSAFLLRKQTAGRGRNGRVWHSEPGGMYVSVLLYPQRPVDSWFALSFATALAIYDVVKDQLETQILQAHPSNSLPQIGLKWPNDVLVNGRKIAGILLEIAENSIIIGSGVNIASIPPIDNNPHPPVAFGDFPGEMPSPEYIAKEYLKRLKFYYDLWEEKGFETLRKLWLSLALHMKEKINVTLDGNLIKGICQELLENGTLILLDDNGKYHRVTAGDVQLIGR